MLSTTKLQYSHDGKSTLIFPEIDLPENHSLLVLGNSGCGKTTLLHLIAGFLTPQKGEVIIDKQKINQLSESACDKFRGRHIGFVFQQSRLISALNVFDNLLIGQYFSRQKNPEKINQLLNDLGLYEKRMRKPSTLSQGEQQRLSIARALVNNPSVLLADEPTAALDDMNTEKVTQLLLEQTEKHRATLLIATHDQRLKEHFKNQLALR